MMFPVIALLLVATFWLLDGLVRARIQRHRTETAASASLARLSSGGPEEHCPLACCCPASPPHRRTTRPPLDTTVGPLPIRVTGIGLATTGVLASFGAQHRGAVLGTTVDPTERPALITSGIFAIVRNPIYAAINIMVMGLTLLVPNGITLAGLVFVITGSQLQVRLIEEP